MLSGDSVSTVEYYDPFAGRWQLASSMCTLRSRVGIAVFKGMFPARDRSICNSFYCQFDHYFFAYEA